MDVVAIEISNDESPLPIEQRARREKINSYSFFSESSDVFACFVIDIVQSNFSKKKRRYYYFGVG